MTASLRLQPGGGVEARRAGLHYPWLERAV
jgi:hypothetical protein